MSILAHIHIHPLTHTHSHTHTLSHTHNHTHSHTHTHTHSDVLDIVISTIFASQPSVDLGLSFSNEYVLLQRGTPGQIFQKCVFWLPISNEGSRRCWEVFVSNTSMVLWLLSSTIFMFTKSIKTSGIWLHHQTHRFRDQVMRGVVEGTREESTCSVENLALLSRELSIITTM